jgi:DNA-binding XRE family transcriptional regulator
MSASMSQYRMLGLIPRNAPKKPPAPILTGSQARVARGLLGWSQADLARRAVVSLADVRQIEADKPVPTGALTRVRKTFEKARVEIVGREPPRLTA